MMLVDLQRRMGDAILQRPTASGGIAPDTDTTFIKANSRLSSAERLEIYSRSYWARVLDSFSDDFPGLRGVVGEKAFRALAEAYLAECPSRSFTLRDLGSRLEQWLARTPSFAGTCPALALDMTRLEWAHIEAFDSEDAMPLGPEDLLELNEDMVFGLKPGIALLRSDYPVDEIRLRAEAARDEDDPAARAAAKRRLRDMVGRCRSRETKPVFIAVHRLDLVVYYKRLAADEFRILQGIERGDSLGAALNAAAGQSELEPSEFLSEIEKWFAAWSRLGWLCGVRREVRSANSL